SGGAARRLAADRERPRAREVRSEPSARVSHCRCVRADDRGHLPSHRGSPVIRGAIAAAVTPLRDAGEALDEDAFAPYVDFLAAGGLDGLLALGTTGEGMLLPQEQRMRAAQLFVEAARGRLAVAVHAGAQSTWET